MGHHGWAFKSGISSSHNFVALTRHVAEEVGTDFVLTTTCRQSYQTYSQSKLFIGVFSANYVPALEPSRSSCSCSFDVVGRSKSRSGGKPPLLLTAVFAPHDAIATGDSYALEIIGDVKEYRDASIQHVAEALKSDAVNCFFRQSELTEYNIFCYSKHGAAWFTVEKASTKRVGAPKTRRRYNTRTRGSIKRRRRR